MRGGALSTIIVERVTAVLRAAAPRVTQRVILEMLMRAAPRVMRCCY